MTKAKPADQKQWAITDRNILEAAGADGLLLSELVERSGYSQSVVYEHVLKMLQRGDRRMHVVRWENRRLRVVAANPTRLKRDAPRPPRKTGSQMTQAYRERHPEKVREFNDSRNRRAAAERNVVRAKELVRKHADVGMWSALIVPGKD